MKIAIDARELSSEPTGVGRFLSEVLAVWRTTVPGHEYILLGTGERLGTAWEQRVLPDLIRDCGADVFFAPAYSGPVRPPVPMVLTIHDVSFAAHPEWFTWREGARRRTVTTLAARSAAAVVTISHFSKREIVAHCGVDSSRVAVVSPGISSPPIEPEGTREARVLYVGSIFNRRHVVELLGAFERIASSHPDARLDLVGHNRTYPHQDVEGLIASSPFAGRISAQAWVSEDQLTELHRTASVFVFLSEYEGFGLTPLEALSQGVAPLVLDTPVAREVCGEAAVYVSSPSVPVVAGALDTLLTDPTQRARVLGHAPEVLGRYSWTACAAEVLRIIEGVA
jgi:glycosyltransferase involved in cell wall biosynthesis